jgi:hypothetical protein
VSERYEEVRRKLVERGYLQGRIERFLLRDLVTGEAPRALARTSLKAAVLGGPMLGGLLAASTVAASRPALGAQDALVLWLYFTIIAGAALFVLDLLAAGLAAAWAARRGARATDALRAGLIVAVPVLAYLVAIWARGPLRAGFAADALFLAGATATAALVAWLAGVVSLAGIVGRTGIVPDRKRRAAGIAIAVLTPIAAAVFMALAAFGSNDSRPIPPSVFPSEPRSQRLLVVGVDGLDGSLVESLADRGATEHLLALLAGGATFAKHRPPGEPPEVWTTLLTGMSVDAHGVRSAAASRLPGVAAPIAARSGPIALDAALRFLLPSRTVPTSGAGRRVRTLWEIAGLTRPALAVGWWASWPARGTEGDPVPGYVVSDRVLAKLLSGSQEDRDTSPPSLYARLERDFRADRTAWRASFDARFAELPKDVRSLAWESYLIDTFAWTTTLRLLEDPTVATSFTYLPGLDILRTRLLARGDTGAAVEAYVRWLDESVFAGLAVRRGERIVLLADPGRGAGPGDEGFVAALGGGAVPRCIGPTIGDLDAAPIVLRLAGLPASVEMLGRVPDRCFEPAGAERPRIGTWGRRGRPVETQASDYDPDMLQRLKSLGYLR